MTEHFSLQELRTQKGLDLNTVAREISINQNILEKIEAGRYRDVGAPVFVRGYIYMYARYLGINEDKIDAFVNQLEFGRAPDLRLTEANIESQSKSYRRSHATLWITLVACIFGFITIAYQLLHSESWLKIQLREAFPKQQTTVETPIAPATEPVVNLDNSEPEEIEITPATPSIQLESTTELTDNPVALEGLTLDEPTPIVESETTAAPFKLTWTGRAWIKITDKNGVITGDKIFTKNHTITLNANDAPFTINIRRPQDVKISRSGNNITWNSITNNGAKNEYILKVVE